MSLKILVIVPCGSSKIWDKFPKSRATRAEEVYIGAPFKASVAFLPELFHVFSSEKPC
jgi:hypothetical protein